jgi:glycerol-3-phosphate dehydrogenase
VTSRESVLDEIGAEDRPWDVLVVGGGATGLGVAVDAATRGHRTLVVERGDLACGTSSRSTKLVHGGVRYLRQGRIALVRDALRERSLLLENAPHVVHPLELVIPVHGQLDRVWYGLGLRIYDRLAGRHALGRTRSLTVEETLGLAPTLDPRRLSGGVAFFDAQFDDARLAVHLAATADEAGGRILNYAEVVELRREGERISGAAVRDVETGRTFEIRARVVTNATGVFADDLTRLDDPRAPRVVSPSQGTHVVLAREFLPGNAAILIPRTADGRVLFVIPWHGAAILGTTDTPVDRATADPVPRSDEIDFLLEHAGRYLGRGPTRADVRSTFAGLRPLVRGGSGATSALSRDHAIAVSRSGLVTITGGKWTTYRRMAQDVVDRAEQVGHLERRRCRTETLRLQGATDAERVREIARDDPALAEPLVAGQPWTCAHVVWAARSEMARTVEDVLSRRTRLLVLDARASLVAAPRVAALLARELGRGAAWAERQVAEYRAVVERHLP